MLDLEKPLIDGEDKHFVSYRDAYGTELQVVVITSNDGLTTTVKVVPFAEEGYDLENRHSKNSLLGMGSVEEQKSRQVTGKSKEEEVSINFKQINVSFVAKVNVERSDGV